MKIILIITIILQIIVGHFLAFFGTYAAGIGGGWELIVWPFWNVLGVWGVGSIIAKQRKIFKKKQYILTLVGTIIGSIIGTVMMANSLGLFVFNPLIGGLIGYYLALLKFFR